MADNTESTAKINFKQAIVVVLITSITTIIVTLISTKGNSTDDNAKSIVSDCTEYKNDMEDFKDISVSAENLSDISSRFFKKDDKAQILKDSIRNVVSLAVKHLNDRSHYAYNLYLLKRILINKPKGNINTRIENDETSTYILIQKILKNIQIYMGELTGDRNETYKALMEFQQKLNYHTDNYFNEENYGILGNKTYIALMEYYKHTN